MKKVFILCIACLTLSAFGAYNTEFKERTMDFYSDMPSSGIEFYKKMQTCSPAVFEETDERVYGKTKNGICHYSYKLYYKGKLTEYHCYMPTRVALAFASTGLDVYGYSKNDSTLAQERLKQNNEMKKIMFDY